MKNTRKILFAILIVATLLVGVFAVTVSAAKTTVETTFYLTPNSNWKQDNPRYAAYTWDGGEQWFDMSDPDGDGTYEVKIPAGVENLIFCRMNPNASTNNWTNKWNQTGDLKYDGTNNHYTVKEGTWDKGGGTWSLIQAGECAHSPKDGTETVITPATCLTDGKGSYICSKCNESFNAPIMATGHTYGADGKCTVCTTLATYIIAGDVMQVGDVYQTGVNFLNANWDVTAEANKLEYDEATGKFTKTYTGVALGEYHIKVAVDKSWTENYGANSVMNGDNYYIKVDADNSTLTITFDAATHTISHTFAAAHTHSWSDATCTEPAKCECGETQGEALGHDIVADAPVDATCTSTGLTAGEHCSRCDYKLAQEEVPALDHTYVEGVCSVCGAADPDYVAPEEPVDSEYVIDFSKQDEFPKGTYADGDMVKYNDIFTFYHGKDSRIDGSSKTFEDGFAGTLRFGFGGKFKTVDGGAGRALQINATNSGTVTLWWVSGGEGRSVDLLGADFEVLQSTGVDAVAADGIYITTFDIPAAGVYYLTNMVNNNYWFKVELTLNEGSDPVDPPVEEHKNALVVGDNKFVVTDALLGQYIEYITFIAAADGKYTFTASEGSNFVFFAYTDAWTENWAYTDPYVTNKDSGEASVSVNLKAGLYIVGVNYFYGGTTAGEYNVNVSVGEYEEGGNDVTTKNTIVLGDNHYVVTDALLAAKAEWLSVALEPGTYTIKGCSPLVVYVFYTAPDSVLTGTEPFVWNVNANYELLDELEFTVTTAGNYWVGINYDYIGNTREFDFTLSLVPPHEHNFVDGKCECGESDPNYVPPHEHSFVDGKCECGESDPNYVPPVEDTPVEEAPVEEAPAEELNIFQKIWKAILDFFKNLLGLKD